MSCKARIIVDSELWGRVEECMEAIERDIVLYPEGRRLHPVEVAYTLYRGSSTVIKENGVEYEFRSFILEYSSRNPLALPLFEVYLELRRRGRLPVPGPRENTLILIRSRRNPKPTHYILVVEEGRPIPLTILDTFVEEARRRNLEPVLAIVDRYGDVTFYTTIVLHPGSARRLMAESLEGQSNP